MTVPSCFYFVKLNVNLLLLHLCDSSLKTLEPMTTKLCRDGPHTKSLVTASSIVTRLSITKPSTHDDLIITTILVCGLKSLQCGM